MLETIQVPSGSNDNALGRDGSLVQVPSGSNDNALGKDGSLVASALEIET